MSDEKRDGERLTVLGDIFGEVMVLEPMLIKEIGTGGATIETRVPLHINSLHDLRVMLGDRPIVVKGRVVHSHISDVDQDVVTYKTRIEFVEPTGRVVSAIEEFLSAVKTMRGGS